MNKYKILPFLITLFLLSCKKSEDNSAPTPALSKEWFGVKQNTGDTINVKDGYLYISTKYNGTSSGATSLGTMKKIKGNFELRVAFSNFKTTDTSSLSESLAFVLSNSSETLYSGVLSNNYIFLMDLNNANTQTKATANRSGEFYVKRTNGDYIAWMRAGSDTTFLDRNSYNTGDLNFNISLSTLDNTSTNTSVHIDDFHITGGGNDIVSDPFNVNNITIY